MNNNIKLEENKEVLVNKNFEEMSVVPDAKNPIQAICETNNKMIDFLQDIYKSMWPNKASVAEI